MPDLIPTHKARAAAKHKPKRQYGKSDPRSARPWRRLREQVLIRDKYTCQGVGANGRRCGRVDISMEVDHIVPRNRGGEDELSNLQTLCTLCHLVKTSSEAGTRPASMTPDWMPKCAKQLYLVCGRPAAGKSRYVLDHAGRGDLVVDLEKIAWEMRRTLHELTKEEMFALIRLRNNRIAAYIKGQTEHSACWIVTVAGRPYQRKFWEDRGAEVVVIDTALEICQRRIVVEDIPADRKESRIQLAEAWQ